jgi:uncharacterized membrane protein
MRTPASILSHPIHPMLVMFPVGLFLFSFFCDLTSRFAADPSPWVLVAFYTLAGGFIGALAAAVPGVIDLLSLRDKKLRKIGVIHMLINLGVVALYGLNLWLRADSGSNEGLPFWLSLLGVLLLSVSAWLGAELVHKHRVGVDEV